MKKVIVDGAPIRNHNLYNRWSKMMQRCYSKSCIDYVNYGGRGITVCDRWHSSMNFINDMSPMFVADYTLERVNNEAGYSPDNCKWIPKGKQSQNRRSLRWIELNGECHYIKDWSRITGIKRTTIEQRLYRYGWSTEKALTVGATT